MKKNDAPQVVRIEINSGTFTIPAGDKLYEITVRQSPTISDMLDGIVTHELAAAGIDVKPQEPAQSASIDQSAEELQRIALYKDISEEMFHEIGRLARDLSISIKDLPSGYQTKVDFEKAGLDLESAKDMLAEVVEMTETATMNIMDISEDMQEQCSIISKALDDVRTLNFVGNVCSGTGTHDKKEPMIILRDVLSGLRTLKQALAVLPIEHVPGADTVRDAIAAVDRQVASLDEEYSRCLNSSDRYLVVDDSYSMVKKEDHDRLIAALEASDHVIQSIINNISRILESLSFQDLSGQRIIKIVGMLSNVQIQLLSILVSSGVKLKRLREGKTIEKKSAEAEVDELMSRFRPDVSKDGNSKNVLDQQAIDSLLEDLGF